LQFFPILLALSALRKRAGTGKPKPGGRCGLVLPYRGERNGGFGDTAADTTSAMRAFNTPAIGSSGAPDCTRHHIFTATYAGPEFFDNVLYIHTVFMKIDGVPYDCLYD
jgi:hypothetical protein